MRTHCLQENLTKALALVSRAVSGRALLPILSNILLDARDNQLRLAATNRAIGISCWIGAKVADEGAITVPARLLYDYVNGLPPGRVDLEVAVRTQTLHLRCADFVASIKGIDAYDFPIIPTIRHHDAADNRVEAVAGQLAECAAAELQPVLERVLFAAASDESRPVLTGVDLHWQRDQLTLAACDNHRLSVHRVRLQQGLYSDAQRVIAPARNLAELARALADGDPQQPVQMLISPGRNQILFALAGQSNDGKGSFHRLEVVSELIDARYPDVQAIIPRTYTTRTVIAAGALLKAVRLTALFARDDANRIQLDFQPGPGASPGTVQVRAASGEIGENSSTLPAQVEGEALTTAFNARYLIDILTRLEPATVVLKSTLPTRPTLLHLADRSEEEFLHVMMPMHG
jgi:DNA polymerase-3 subunit beta